MTGHGFTIGKAGEVLQVRDRKQVVQEVRLGEVSQVNIFFRKAQFERANDERFCLSVSRSLVADSVVLSAINTHMVAARDLVRAGRAVSLTSQGRSALIRAYEQRIDTLVTHPLFGYRVSYRRVLEIQARLLARFVSGELAAYEGFETR